MYGRRIIMGRQVRFYAIDDDYASLLHFVHDKGLLALPHIVSSDLYDLTGHAEAVSPLHFQHAENEDKFYLIPQEIPVVEAFYRQMTGRPSESVMMPYVSPVIELVPCCREGDKVYQGRIYIDAPTDDPWSSVVYEAYERLASHIKKWTDIGYSTCVGPHTLQCARNGTIRLMVTSNRQLQIPE